MWTEWFKIVSPNHGREGFVHSIVEKITATTRDGQGTQSFWDCHAIQLCTKTHESERKDASGKVENGKNENEQNVKFVFSLCLSFSARLKDY